VFRDAGSEFLQAQWRVPDGSGDFAPGLPGFPPGFPPGFAGIFYSRPAAGRFPSRDAAL